MHLSDHIADYPIRHRGRQLAVLRGCDILLSAVALVIFAPVIVFLALAIRMDSPGPALFCQERLGQDRRPFTLWKFRTMVADAEAETGAVWAQRGDPRITRLGRFLRRARLDELPQFVNVLRGEMSLVGPRPIRAVFADRICAIDPGYEQRFRVRPGLTGYAQLYAPYGADMAEQLAKIPHDQRYHREGLSVFAYLSLIAKTAARCLAQPFGQ